MNSTSELSAKNELVLPVTETESVAESIDQIQANTEIEAALDPDVYGLETPAKVDLRDLADEDSGKPQSQESTNNGTQNSLISVSTFSGDDSDVNSGRALNESFVESDDDGSKNNNDAQTVSNVEENSGSDPETLDADESSEMNVGEVVKETEVESNSEQPEDQLADASLPSDEEINYELDVADNVDDAISEVATEAESAEENVSEELALTEQTESVEKAIDLSDTTGIAAADSLMDTKPKDLVGKRNHEIFLGIQANFNLPLIFNQNTYEVFSGKELAYKSTFGIASGVRLGYTYKQQYGFETGFIFYSRQGQDYEESFSGVTAKRQVKFQYFQIPIVLRYKFKEKKTKKFPSPWVIDLGAQIDLLQSAAITYNGNDFPLDTIQNPAATDIDYFRATTVSAVIALEREIYFTKFLFLGIGIRTTFSSDINAKDRPVVNDGKGYAKSHNFTFGFTLSLNGALQW